MSTNVDEHLKEGSELYIMGALERTRNQETRKGLRKGGARGKTQDFGKQAATLNDG